MQNDSPEPHAAVRSATTELALEALAAARGIESHFVDAFGVVQEISLAVRARLLAASGVRTDSPELIEAEVARFEREAWGRCLPSTLVITRDRSAWAVELVLPQDTREVNWRIELENGAVRRGRVEFQALPLLESRRLTGASLERRCLELPASLPDGYHVLSVEPGVDPCQLIVSPGRCWLPMPRADGRRLWGLSVPVALIRSDHNWGIGDFSDLARLTALAARHGAEVVGVSPLHAGFPAAPSSRVLLNAIFIDVTAVPGFDACPEVRALLETPAFREQLAACRQSRLVDYAVVWQLKMSALRLLYQRTAAGPDSQAWRDFQSFIGAQDEALTRGCVFQALHERLGSIDPTWADWRAWPAQFRHPESEAVERFAIENAEEVQFHVWLQWLADRQLRAVAATARDMSIGLYRALAVGVDPGGAECWSDQSAVTPGVRIGAPPDLFHRDGQDWGLMAFSSEGLRAQGYQPFLTILRAHMRHAGALHIDHVVGWRHLWCIPEGLPASEGAYIGYNLEDLLGIVTLESQRHRCTLVGEDFGPLPDGLRERLLGALLQLDDATAEIDPVNPPGTSAEYPNLRRKLSRTLEDLEVATDWLPKDLKPVD